MNNTGEYLYVCIKKKLHEFFPIVFYGFLLTNSLDKSFKEITIFFLCLILVKNVIKVFFFHFYVLRV